MNVLTTVLGIILLASAFIDAIWTTLWVDGNAGPLAEHVSRWMWRAWRAVVPAGHHKALSLAGPLALTLTVLLWVLLLWGGWRLTFGSNPNTLVTTIFFTLAISYLLSIVAAVVEKRLIASEIAGLGEDAESLVLKLWDGQGFPGAVNVLNALATQVTTLAEQHRAYPILQIYHAAKPSKGSAPTLAILDDSLTLLRFGVAPEHRIAPAILTSARAAVRSYLNTHTFSGISPADETPPTPTLDRLREAGIPVVAADEFRQTLDALQDRRRLLLGFVQYNAYEWPPLP